MKNNTLNQLLKGTKFSTLESENKDAFIAEMSIALLIINGQSFEKLFDFLPLIKKKKDREEMTTKTTNLILDFIQLNPEYAEVLKQNNEAHVFLKNFGLDFDPNSKH